MFSADYVCGVWLLCLCYFVNVCVGSVAVCRCFVLRVGLFVCLLNLWCRVELMCLVVVCVVLCCCFEFCCAVYCYGFVGVRVVVCGVLVMFCVACGVMCVVCLAW